jgi:trk system potassium uptake protein TrkA
MRILIIGAGEVGYHIATRLVRERHDVVVVDHVPEVIARVQEEMDVMVFEGHGSRPETLERAGIDQTELVIAVTHSDEVNMVACLLARQYGVPQCIARIHDGDVETSPLVAAGKRIGIDLMINPSRAVAEEIQRLIHMPGADEAAEFFEGRVQLISVRVPPSAPIVQQQIKEVGARFPGDLPGLVAAIQRGRKTLIPRGETIIEAEDHLLIIGKDQHLQANLHLLGLSSHRMKNLLIIGGGHVGLQVAHLLSQDAARYNIKILERHMQRCHELATLLPHALVLNGDATDLRVLQEEGIRDMDGVIVVTDDDGTNLIAALLAKTHGAHEVITLVKRPDLVSLVSALGIDAAISPRLITADAMLRYLRRGQVLSMFTSTSTEAETLEMEALPRARIVGRPLYKVNIPEGIIIGAIAHGDTITIPRGDTVIEAYDRVLVFALPQAVSKATRLLGG